MMTWEVMQGLGDTEEWDLWSYGLRDDHHSTAICGSTEHDYFGLLHLFIMVPGLRLSLSLSRPLSAQKK